MNKGSISASLLFRLLVIMKKYAEKFYKGIAWQNCRNAYMKKVHGLCEDCMEMGIYNPAEEVHHVIELNANNINDPTISLNMNNLRALCRECHRKRHGKQMRYKVDKYGRVEPI